MSPVVTEGYNALQKHVDGYVKIQIIAQRTTYALILRCKVKDKVGYGSPTDDGYEVVKFANRVIQDASDPETRDKAAKAFQKFCNHHEASKRYFKRYPEKRFDENRGAVSLLEVYADDYVVDDMDPGFRPVFYEDEQPLVHERSRWMYIIDLGSKSVEVHERFLDRTYDFGWLVSFNGITTEWMDYIKTDTRGNRATKLQRENRSPYITALYHFSLAVERCRETVESVGNAEATALVKELVQLTNDLQPGAKGEVSAPSAS